MDISIITSLYRSSGHLAGFLAQLEACVRAVESRGLTAECIIVSNTPDRRERPILKAAFDSPWWSRRGRLLVVPRETLYASWNRGVRASTGGAITFWNVDDCRSPAAMAEGVGLLRQGGGIVRFPWIHVIEQRPARGTVDRRVEIKDDGGEPNDCRADFCIGPFFMFSRDLFEKCGPFDEQFHIIGDYDWQLRAASITTPLQGKRLGGTFFSDGTNLSASGSQRRIVEHNVLTVRHQLERPLWPLDEQAARLFRSYRIEGSQMGGSTADWSYDRRWLRQQARSAVCRSCRRTLGGLARSVRRHSAGERRADAEPRP
jgi:hypothetical protein